MKSVIPCATASAGLLVLIALKRFAWSTSGEERKKVTEAAKDLVGRNPIMISLNPRNEATRMLTSLHTGSVPITAVIIHGFGCCSMEWEQVSQSLESRDISVFNYDRILFVEGRENLPSRNVVTLVQELHILLQSRNVSEPLILIGHSYGGLVAQYYAMSYPDEVHGLVLIDPAHEDQFKKFPWDFTMGFKVAVPIIFKLYQNIAWTGILKFMDALSLFNFPPLFLLPSHSLVRRTAVELYSDGKVWHTVAQELVGCIDSFRRMKTLRKPFSDALPVGLVIAFNREHSPTLFPKDVTKAFLEMHEHMKAKIFMADKSDHWVHMQQPFVVMEAVDYVLSQIKLSK